MVEIFVLCAEGHPSKEGWWLPAWPTVVFGGDFAYSFSKMCLNWNHMVLHVNNIYSQEDVDLKLFSFSEYYSSLFLVYDIIQLLYSK